jgi:hypothetical protein
MFDAPYGLVLYGGHSSAGAMVFGDAALLSRNDWPTAPASIFVTCGCFATQYTDSVGGRGEGYGVAAVRSPKGPVAVIGPMGESYAFAGKLAFDALMTDFETPDGPPTLGALFNHVKEGVASGQINAFTFRLYDQADGTHGKVPLADQRKEHVEMWTLLGDPAMRLPAPAPRIALDSVTLIPGKIATVTGTLPLEALGSDVVLSLHRNVADPPAKPGFDAANDTLLATVTVPGAKLTREALTATGPARDKLLRFSADFLVPADVPAKRLILRAVSQPASDASRACVGATYVNAAPAPTTRP